jgi:hypothetical protein
MNKEFPTMSIVAEVSALRAMSIGELRGKYYEVFGEESRSRNKEYLFKRVAYRIQERAEGAGLSERARQRASELARNEDLRVRGHQLAAPLELAPPPKTSVPARKRDPRLPGPGAVLKRTVGGVDHEVHVLDDGFEYRGKVYRSLSAVAIQISGTHQSGYTYFGLAKAKGGAR